MDWLAQNWTWIFVLIVMVLMMRRGGMGCGMGHDHRSEPQTESGKTNDTAGKEGTPSARQHRHHGC